MSNLYFRVNKIVNKKYLKIKATNILLIESLGFFPELSTFHLKYNSRGKIVYSMYSQEGIEKKRFLKIFKYLTNWSTWSPYSESGFVSDFWSWKFHTFSFQNFLLWRTFFTYSRSPPWRPCGGHRDSINNAPPPPTLKPLYFEKLPHWPTLKILDFS